MYFGDGFRPRDWIISHGRVGMINMRRIAGKPILMIAAVLICLGMLRLGVWQLDRAEQKQAMFDRLTERQEQEPLSLNSVDGKMPWLDQVYRPATLQGYYLPQNSILIDNQVHQSRPGYRLITPAQTPAGQTVMVDRGWLAAGPRRDQLPAYTTPAGSLDLRGRLVRPIAAAPLWNDEHPVFSGAVWQHLALDVYRAETGLEPIPLVLELAPDSQPQANLVREWRSPAKRDVSRHKAYALQWFAMAVVFFIACMVVAVRTFEPTGRKDD